METREIVAKLSNEDKHWIFKHCLSRLDGGFSIDFSIVKHSLQGYASNDEDGVQLSITITPKENR